jgi:parallel beta-helix repeat protein
MNKKNGMGTDGLGPRWQCVAAISRGRSWVALLLTAALLCGCASRKGTATKTVGRAGNKLIVSPAKAGESSSQRLAAALAQAARQHEQSGKTVTILLRRGIYFLDEPLVLRPEDSGIVLAAYRRQRPVLSGGRRITDWKKVTVNGKHLWAAEIPEVREGKWFFRELWVNGRRATRARDPNQGYFHIASLPDKSPVWSKGQTRFKFHVGDLRAWPSVTNAEVVAMTRWVESRLPVTSVDEADRIVNFGKRSVFELQKGDPYYIENVFEALDAPGEWYLDPATGTLYYEPRPGERMNRIDAIAPVLTQVVRLEGKPKTGQFVDHVEFRGLTFSHAEWNLAKVGDKKATGGWPAPTSEVGGFNQAAVGVPGAVWGEGVRDCVFKDCKFLHLGSYGLELARGCQSNRISHCELADLGAGGIKIGEQAIRADAAERAQANEISDCRIHDGGNTFQSGIGIWIGQSPNNRIVHNLIHDFYYTGISIGWTWGYGPALASNNIVDQNIIHHIGVKSDGDGPVLSDMGGIYTLGKQPGTRITRNLWHDIAGFSYGGWGIYFDEGSSGILAEDNIVYRTTHGGFHQHYGETNTVRNNIFAFGRDQQLQRSREEPHLSFTFTHNIVYFNSGVLLGSTWKNDHFIMDWNIYWDTRLAANPDEMKFAGATLGQWRARGHDEHSLIADPLFVAPQKDNFQLKPDSLAFKLGFHAIDLSGVGPRPR